MTFRKFDCRNENVLHFLNFSCWGVLFRRFHRKKIIFVINIGQKILLLQKLLLPLYSIFVYQICLTYINFSMKKRHLFLFLLVVTVNYMNAQQKVYKYGVGSYTVHLLSERQSEGNKEILIGATAEMMKQSIPDGTFPMAMNCFLIETGKETILIDAGVGFGLFECIKMAGKKPEDIDAVYITHLHGDHFGGLMQEGQKSFPNIKLYVSKAEFDYWISDKAKNADNARKVLEMYKDNLVLFEPGTFEKPYEEIKGIKGIATYGHTPGHTCFLIESDNSKLFIWGDLTHAMAIQMPFPQVAVTYDVDPKMAVETRKWVLEYLETNKIPIAGMHIKFPAIGYLKQNPKQGYDFELVTE